jgi:hypothetical protein
MSDTQPIDLNSASLGIGRHVSGLADPFNGHIDEFRLSHVQPSDGWIETTLVRSPWRVPRNRRARMASRHRWQALVWSSA